MAAKKGQTYRHLPAFILLILTEGNAHGGAVFNKLKESLPAFECDSGAIYRTLQSLEKDGEVAFEWDTSDSGPARKIYSITEAGRESLYKWKLDIEHRIVNLQYFIDTYNNLSNTIEKGEKNDSRQS